VPVLNIAAYRFVSLDGPADWVATLFERADGLGLKGTVIVADEGINLFLAGEPSSIEAFISWLARDPRFVASDGRQAFVDLHIKRSRSDAQPFRRLRVKHKAEIVTMRRPTVRPDRGRAPTIAPHRLAAWLAQGHDDDGRPFKLLDTRNAFEVAHGTFDGAEHLDLARFEAFPDAIDRSPRASRDETIVTFCTGGIRCEKAALYMRDHGYARVLQLDGGILGYFAEVGDAHFHGDCFVFDERVALKAETSG
jgi:UPF0176 protein